MRRLLNCRRIACRARDLLHCKQACGTFIKACGLVRCETHRIQYFLTSSEDSVTVETPAPPWVIKVTKAESAKLFFSGSYSKVNILSIYDPVCSISSFLSERKGAKENLSCPMPHSHLRSLAALGGATVAMLNALFISSLQGKKVIIIKVYRPALQSRKPKLP